MIYNHNIKGKCKAIGLLCCALLGFMPFLTACSDYVDELRDNGTVAVSFFIQSSEPTQTRAYIDKLDAVETNESKINTVQAWLFQGTTRVGYAGDYDADNNIVTVSVPRTAVSQPVDIYIIANAASAGVVLTENSTPAEIMAAQFADGKFTAASKTEAVPTDGLPMSMIVKGVSLLESNGDIKTTLGEFKLTRAVSKILFAFGMYQGDLGEIVGISLDGDQIAGQQMIMPVDPASDAASYTDPYVGDLKANIVSGSYEAAELLYGSKADGDTPAAALIANGVIKKTETDDNPSNYAWENWSTTTEHSALSSKQKADQYYAAVKPFVQKTVYLRESDKKLTGKIYYRLQSGAAIQSRTFTMDAAQDFARNHVWIVYAYFEGGKLYVKPTVAPWENAAELEYTLKMSTNMRLFDSWLYRYDTDGNYDDYTKWATSHIAVSDGRITEETLAAPETVAGRPLYSPQIQLVTTGTGTFDLVVDNPDFEIVRANKNTTGVVTSYDASTDGKLTIAAGDDVHTYFYIVPKVGVTPSNPVAKVSLIYNDPVLGPQKVTYNYNALPGYSDDSAEIWAYYVTNENYNITGKLKMYYQDASHPLVPTTVQN